MFHARWSWRIVGGVLVLAGLTGSASSARAQLRIMPLGDSITAGVGSPQLGGYRLPLWDALQWFGWDAEFVGSQSDGPPRLGSKANEGHGGYRIDQIAAGVDQWLETYQPEVILLLIGTNDCLQDYQFATVRQRMEDLIDRILHRRPHAFLVVSTVLPLRDLEANARAVQINEFLPAVVAARWKRGHQIMLVNMYAMLNPWEDMPDGIHPDPVGYAVMAAVWYDALLDILLFG